MNGFAGRRLATRPTRQQGDDTLPCKTREEQRRFQREWIAARRAAYLNGKKCAVCGATEKLTLHHKDPAKKTSHNVWSWSEPRRRAELRECEVLCKSCHQRIHARVRRALASVRFPCGTNASYSRGCRCDDCTTAHREANYRWLRRQGTAA